MERPISKQLIDRAQAGDERASDEILKRIDLLLRQLSQEFYCEGFSPSDIVQEARLGAWSGIKTFRPTGGMAFENFLVNVCARRHLINVIASANSKKHSPLNSAACLPSEILDTSNVIDDLTERILLEEKIERHLDMCEAVMSPMEFTAYTELLASYGPYASISANTKLSVKQINNTLIRARIKARELWQALEDEADLD